MAKTNTPKAPETVNKPEPKPGELPKLFKAYEDADKELRALEASLEAATLKRSDAVKAIGAFGTGPYEYKGKLLTVTSRKNEEAFKRGVEAGQSEEEATKRSTRFFFKTTGEQTITKVA